MNPSTMTSLDADSERLLRLVSRSEAGLDVATIYRRTGMLPAQIAAAADFLRRRGLVTVTGMRIELTNEGLKHLIANHAAIRNKAWRKPPEDWLKPRLGVTEPYVPRRSRIVPSILK